MNKKLLAAILVGLMTFTGSALAADKTQVKNTETAKGAIMQTEQKLQLEEKWDKVFPLSNKVDHKKITFHNRYGVTLVADMYIPKNSEGKKLPALAVAGPFGAVKEQ
ncbi:MAG: alpha/beta hydrolase, partial [Acidaminococcaceae bacterium]|nr:alpha/beta hydrolase [Acidaminococcaceae bacterium]